MKKAGLYLRVSTGDQHVETQLHDLRQLAQQRGLEVVKIYQDHLSGAKARRPGLDQLLTDARQAKFDVLLTWSCDRIARSTRHFLEVLDELAHLGIAFVSFRETLDTEGPLGRAVIIIVGAIAELERSLIRERVLAGLRRARAEGRPIGRPRLVIDRQAVIRDRARGMSLNEVARVHHISKASVCKILKETTGGHKLLPRGPSKTADSAAPESALPPV